MSAALVVRPAMDENLMVPFPAMRSPEAQFPENVLLSAFTHLRSLSGSSSTVAIDNKIEQAMDLVKTHLMFAVREEVEVLKEQIKELMERIGNLEWENSYLRANVPPEVLTRMAQAPRTLPSSSSS